MPNHRVPKVMLFGWLPQPRSRCVPQRRWREVVERDLKAVEVGKHEWFEEVKSRMESPVSGAVGAA